MSVFQAHLGGEFLGEALLLGPLVVVGGSVLFKDLEVLRDEVLAAECADGHGLSGLDGSAVLVHLDTSAGGVGLPVLARNAVLLCDGHGERRRWWWSLCVLVVLFLLLCGRDVGAGKLDDLDSDLGTLEDPFFILLLESRRKFLVTVKYHSTAEERDCQIGSSCRRGTSLERVPFTFGLFTCRYFPTNCA